MSISAYMYVCVMCLTLAGQKRQCVPLELELQTVASYHEDSEN